MSLTVIPFSSSYSIRTKVRRVGTLPHAGNVGCSNCQAERVLPTRSCHRASLFSWAPPFFFVKVCVFRLTSHDLLRFAITHTQHKVQHVYTTKLKVGMRMQVSSAKWCLIEPREPLRLVQKSKTRAEHTEPMWKSRREPSGPTYFHTITTGSALSKPVNMTNTTKHEARKRFGHVWLLWFKQSFGSGCVYWVILTQESRMGFSSVCIPFLTRGQSPRSWF